MNTAAISIIFLVLLALTIIVGRHAKAGIGRVPLLYKSIFIKFFLNVSVLLFIGFSIYLLFYNWKFFLILLMVGFIIEGFIVVPLVEWLIFKFVEWLKFKAMSKN